MRAAFETDDLLLLLGGRRNGPLRMDARRVDGLAEEAGLAPVPHDRAQEAEISHRQRAAVNRYCAGRGAGQTSDRVRVASIGIVHTEDPELQAV